MWRKLYLLVVFSIFFITKGWAIEKENKHILVCEPYFYEVAAQGGDYISKLLQRYYVGEHSCNYEQFYQLNGLDSQSQLIAGKEYYIPVLIYDYDGKSIRSTLEMDNWAQAIRIKKYNERIRKDKHRRYGIAESGILWVPYHELHCFNNRIRKTTAAEDEAALVKVKKPRKESSSTTFIPAPEQEDRQEEADEYIAERTKPKDRNYVKMKKVTNVEEAIEGERKFAIFGKNYAHIPLEDESLKGKVFYIVGGHGGPDSGAVGKRLGKQLCEDEYAYDVALRVCRNLIAHGATAYMIIRDPNDGIRDEQYLALDRDEYCWGDYKIPRSQKQRLFQRSDAINELYLKHKKQGVSDQVTVAIHIDSRSQRERTDVFFYYYPSSKKGKKLAKGMQKTIKSKYKKHNPKKRYSGTVSARNLHMLREPYTTSLYIELGNIRNPSDQQRFIITSNRQALADWLFDGLVDAL